MRIDAPSSGAIIGGGSWSQTRSPSKVVMTAEATQKQRKTGTVQVNIPGFSPVRFFCDEDIPIVSVILNNSALGWVKHGQGNRTIASTFSEMDFAAIAKSMGVHGIRVTDPKDLPSALNEALTSGQPTVVDVVTSFKPSFRDVTSPLAAG